MTKPKVDPLCTLLEAVKIYIKTYNDLTTSPMQVDADAQKVLRTARCITPEKLDEYISKLCI